MSSRSHCRTRSCGRSRRLPGSITGRSSGRSSRTRASSRSRWGSSPSRSSRWRSGPRASYLPLARYAHTRRSGLTSPRRCRPPFERARALLDEAEAHPRAEREGDRPRALRARARGAQDGPRRAARGDGRRRRSTRRPSSRRSSAPTARSTSASARGARARCASTSSRSSSPSPSRMALRALRRRGVQDPERVDDPDAAGRRPHLREQVHLRPGHPVHATSGVWTRMPPAPRRRHGLRVPGAPRAGLHQARDRRCPGDKLEARNGHPWINGWEVPHCFVGVYSYNEANTDSEMPAPPQRHEGDLFVEYLEDQAYLTLYDHATGGYSDAPGPLLGEARARSGSWGTTGTTATTRACGGADKGGGVPFENIRGRALFVWLSTFDGGMDWSASARR